MAAPPQFRPGPPGPPGAQGPGGPQQFGPPGAPGGPMGPPGTRSSYPMGSFNGPNLPSIGDGHKKKRKGKKRRDDSSSSEEDECKCPPQQPATQIFITPPGMGMPPQMGQNWGGCDPSNCEKGGGAQNLDPMKLCMQQCYKGQEDTSTKVIYCPPCPPRPPPSSSGQYCFCQQKKRQKAPTPPRCCCQCDEEGQKGRKKKSEYGTMEGMMPATQQFLMFLQAYGLAAALIRNRNETCHFSDSWLRLKCRDMNKREEERLEKERKEKNKKDREEEECECPIKMSLDESELESPKKKGDKGKKKK